MFFYVQRKVHPMHSTRIYSQESLAFSIFKTASRRLIPDAIFNNRRIYLWITSCQNENRALSLSLTPRRHEYSVWQWLRGRQSAQSSIKCFVLDELWEHQAQLATHSKILQRNKEKIEYI